MSDLVIPAVHAQLLRGLATAAVDFTDQTAEGDERRQAAAFTLAVALAGLIAMDDERRDGASIVDRHSIGFTHCSVSDGERSWAIPDTPADSGSTPVSPDPVTKSGESPMNR